MRKKVLFIALLSAVLLVGCNGYSKVSAAKAKEVQATNLQKEINYKGAKVTKVVNKLDINLKSDNLPADAKNLLISAAKLDILKGLGVEEVGKKVEKEITSTFEMDMYRLPAMQFVEEEGTTYYMSGSKLKVVSKGKEDGLDVKATVLINEYGYVTSATTTSRGEMIEEGMTFSVSLSYKTTIKYSKEISEKDPLVESDKYSEASAKKAQEIQATNLQKEVKYTKVVTNKIVNKLDIQVDGNGLSSEEKVLTVASLKSSILGNLGVKEVGQKVVEETEQFDTYRMPVDAFVEETGTTYYTSGNKIKVVTKANDNGLRATQTIMIDEYGYMTSVDMEESGTIVEQGLIISVNYSYNMTLDYIK